MCLNQLGRLVEKGRDLAPRGSEADRHGSYFLGLKIRGKGDEDAPLFVTNLFGTTDNTEVDIGNLTNTVMDSVTDESTGGDECYGCDAKIYNLLNLEIQLAQIEQYTTAMERELEEKENLEEKPSYAERYPLGPESKEQAQSTDGDRLQENGNIDNEPAPTVTNPVTDDEDDELKVGDKVIYVGKKYQESIGNQVMEVVKISVHWTGNQITCSYDRGWTTWIPESSLKKAKPEKDHD